MTLDQPFLAIARKHRDSWLDADPAFAGKGLTDYFESAIQEALALRDKNWEDGNGTLRHERDKAKEELVECRFACAGFQALAHRLQERLEAREATVKISATAQGAQEP